jgi:hypothetical protein
MRTNNRDPVRFGNKRIRSDWPQSK